MTGYIKVSNGIFDLGLETNELTLYTYLLSIHTSKYEKSFYIKQRKISKVLGYSQTQTVSKIISSLENKGLIKIIEHYKDGKRKTNSYKLNKLSLENGYFILNRNIINKIKEMGKSTFSVYLYILKCMNSKKKIAFPSINEIKKALHMGKSTVCNAIKYLTIDNVFKKLQCIKKDNSYGRNTYYFNYIEKSNVKEKTDTNISTDNISEEIEISEFFLDEIKIYNKKVVECESTNNKIFNLSYNEIKQKSIDFIKKIKKRIKITFFNTG